LGGTPKRSLSVSSGATERIRASTVKQVWPCHPARQFLRSAAKDLGIEWDASTVLAGSSSAGQMLHFVQHDESNIIHDC
jgi:hypothetical protein